MQTEKVNVSLPMKNPNGDDILVQLTVSVKDGIVQGMTCVQIKNWNENEQALCE